MAGRSGACRRRPRAAPPRLALTVYRLGKATSKPAVGRAVRGTRGTAHQTRNTGARAVKSAPGTRNHVSAASSVFPEARSSCVTRGGRNARPGLLGLVLPASLRPASAARMFGQIPGARALVHLPSSVPRTSAPVREATRSVSSADSCIFPASPAHESQIKTAYRGWTRRCFGTREMVAKAEPLNVPIISHAPPPPRPFFVGGENI